MHKDLSAKVEEIQKMIQFPAAVNVPEIDMRLLTIHREHVLGEGGVGLVYGGMEPTTARTW